MEEYCDIEPKPGKFKSVLIGLKGFFPFLSWWPLLSNRTLKADAWAGLTGAVIVLPQGVAFAAIAGMPPVYGLYAAIVPVIVAALFGSSYHLISGPTTAISLVIFSNLSQFAEPYSLNYVNLALSITLMAGIFQLTLGIARLGVVVNFVSHSVVTGFTAGAAILIATSQLGHFLGINLPRGGSFLDVLISVAGKLSLTNFYVLGIAAFTLISAFALKAFKPRYPGFLIALVAASFLNHLLNGSAHGVSMVGALPSALPSFSLPEINLKTIRDLAPGALAMAMLGLAEAVSIARSVADKSQQMLNSNQEFIGQGLSNIIGSFFSGYASSGSFTRTGVNYEAGAKTPMAAIFSAIFLALILLIVAPLTAYLPLAAMAGVILVVAAKMIDLRSFCHIVHTDKSEAAILGATFLATLFVQLEFAIYSGVLLSLLIYLKRTSHPHFITLAPDPDTDRRGFVNIKRKNIQECPQIKILRLDGSIFFGAVNHITTELHRIIEKHPEQCHILFVASGINFIDVGGCHMLFHEVSNLKLSGRQLYFCSIKSDVLDILARGGCLQKIGPNKIFASKKIALKEIINQVDPQRCMCCPNRVFEECRYLAGGEFYPANPS